MKTMPSPPIKPFDVCVVLDGDEAVLTLAGELDMATADVLERELRTLRDEHVARMVLDLRDVEFVDSSGLRTLINLRNTAKRQGRGLTLVPGPARVQRIFELTGTRGLFDWRD